MMVMIYDDGDNYDGGDGDRKESVGNRVDCVDSWPRTNPPVIILRFYEDGDYGDYR